MNIDCCKSYIGKQIIGLLPGGAEECLYVLVINSQDYIDTSFIGWTLNGNDFITELSNYGTVYEYQNDTGAKSVYVNYFGTQPTDLNVTTNSMGDVLFTIIKVTDYEGGSCDLVCYQASFDYGYEYSYIDYFAAGAASPRLYGSGQPIDDDLSLYGQIAAFLGPQISVTSVWNGSQYVVTINNAFNLGGFQLGDGAPVYTTFTALPCEIVPPTPVPLELLDAYPGAGAAYSVRKLSSSYTGSALRVRRSSDNTEQDIGFVGMYLDTTALTNFVGAGNGFVTKWYDQSGNNRDAAQTTSSWQSKIVNSGTIITENGKPAIEFITNTVTGAKLTITGLTTQLNSSFLVSSVVKANTQTGYRGIFTTTTTGSNGMMMLSRGGTNNWGTYGNAAYRQSNSNIQAAALTLITMQSSNGNAGNFYKNSSADGTFTDTEGQTYVGIGGQQTQEFNGKISEVIAYPTDQSVNRTGIETNIINYYGL
jgi:hypothetical protein